MHHRAAFPSFSHQIWLPSTSTAFFQIFQDSQPQKTSASLPKCCAETSQVTKLQQWDVQGLNRSLLPALHGPDRAGSASLLWAQLLLKAAVSQQKETTLTRSWCSNEMLYTVISCSNGQRIDGREHCKKSLKKLPQVLNMAQQSVHSLNFENY